MRKWIWIIIGLFIAGNIKSQDLHFSQFNEIPILRNPALTNLFSGKARVTGIYRNQWRNIARASGSSIPFITSAASGVIKLKGYCLNDPETLTLGLHFFNDKSGDGRLSNTSAMASLGYKLNLGAVDASIGFYGGLVSSGYDRGNLTWNDQYVNGLFSSSNPTNQPFASFHKTYENLGTGILLNNNSTEGMIYWYAGLAVYNITQPRIEFGNVEQRKLWRTGLNGGAKLVLEYKHTIDVYTDFMFQSNIFWKRVGGGKEFMIGGIFTPLAMDGTNENDFSIGLGGFYRMSDSFIPSVKLRFRKVDFGFSYDVGTSQLRGNSLELFLRFNFFDYEKIERCIPIGCPPVPNPFR